MGYEDGILHVQLRYDGLFAYQYQYLSMPPMLIDNEETILETSHGTILETFQGKYSGAALKSPTGDIRNYNLMWMISKTSKL